MPYGFPTILAAAAVAAADPGRPVPIVNGVPEPGFSAAVALDYGFAACTGSLVTPRIVLTAAHCVSGLPVEAATIVVGSDLAAPRHALAVERGVAHPEYAPPSPFGSPYPTNDVAVVILREDAPAEVTPIPFRTDPLGEPEAQGATVTSVGFGLDENDVSGIKRSAELRIEYVQTEFLVTLAAENEGNATLCSGDSGGPQYHVEDDGRTVQWAVHSWSDAQCSVMAGSARADVHAEWLLDQAEEVHGTRDVCRLFDRYGDGVCDEGCAEADPDCPVETVPVEEPEPEPEPVEEPEPAPEEPGGCATVPGAPWLAVVVALAGRARRRGAMQLR